MHVSGHLEVLEWGADHLFAVGWLRIPTEFLSNGVSPLLRVAAADGAAVEWPLRRLRDRPDLPPSSDLPAGKGFEVLIPIRKPATVVSAQLVAGGLTVTLGPEPAEPRPFRPRGALEMPNRYGLAGWVLDVPGRLPELIIDDRIRVPLPLTWPRPDLPFDTGESSRPLGFRIPLEALGDALRAADPGATLLDGNTRNLCLTAAGVDLGRRQLRWPRAIEGRLDRAGSGEAVGWAVELDSGDESPTLDLLIDGTRWQTVAATGPMAQVAKDMAGRIRNGSFRAVLPRRNPSEAPSPEVAVRPAHARQVLPGTATLRDLPPWRPDHGQLLATLPANGFPQVSIIVPIYNAADDLSRCVEAVLRHTTGPARLILVDDASTDPAISSLLKRWEGLPGIEIHRNQANLGFTATANRGMALAGRDDVVLLNSDTAVGPGWLDGLRLAAHAGPDVGTVTPLSNNAGAFSVPEFNTENRFPDWFSPADMARLARQSSLSLLPTVPTGNGFCLYIRRICLDAIGGFDEAAFPRGYGEENDFCMRAQRTGFRNVVDDRTLVWHRRSASFGSERQPHMEASRAVLAERYPEYPILARTFRDDMSFLAIRWRVRRAVEAVLAAGGVPRPRVLFVISTQSGGTPQTNRDLMEALADRYEPWVLRCEGATLELSRHEEGMVETHLLEQPVKPGTHRSPEYDARVMDILIRYGFELVHIRHLAWHGIGLPGVCRRLGIPVIFSFHDFYTACPTVKLLDAEDRFCGGRCTQGEGDCVAELWKREEMPPLRGRFVHRWRAMMSEALELCDAFVTTSAGTRRTLLEAFPFLKARDFRVIQHGRSFDTLETLGSEPSPDEPLRVLVPGNISRAKGGALIAEIAAVDRGRSVEFHVLGNVDATLREDRPGVVRYGPYARDSFADYVQAIRPHIGAVLSIWPETYCHTLTECWAVGLPVVTTNLGAQGERVTETGAGWLLEPSEPAERFLDFLRELRSSPDRIQKGREAVFAWQSGQGRHYDVGAMAASYDRLYREVFAKRRSFAAAAPTPRCHTATMLPSSRMPPLGTDALFRNSVESPLIVRTARASLGFGDAGVVAVDLVRLPPGSVAVRDMAALLQQCRNVGARVVLEIDHRLVSDLEAANGSMPEVIDALGADHVTTIALDTPALAWLSAAGLAPTILEAGLDAVAWSRPLQPELRDGPRTSVIRILMLRGETELPVHAHQLLDDLRTLDVAEPLWLDKAWQDAHATAPNADATTFFRLTASQCDLAFLPEAWSPVAGDLLPLAALAAGLPLVRPLRADENAGEQTDGSFLLPGDPRTWARHVAELAVDHRKRRDLAQRATRQALRLMRPVDPAASIAALLRHDAPSTSGTERIAGQSGKDLASSTWMAALPLT